MDIGVTAIIGSLARLPKITGNESLLREMAFTSRTFSAEEAQELGLVSKVVSGGKDDVLGEMRSQPHLGPSVNIILVLFQRKH